MKSLSLLVDPGKQSISNAPSIELSRMVRIDNIKLRDEFKSMFPVNESRLETITKNIAENGFDASQPLHLWEFDNQLVLIDGHHRRLGAMKAGLMEVPCFIHQFDSIDAAIEYALSLQVDRRNLNDAELLAAIATLDTVRRKRGPNKDGQKGKSSEITAKALGTSKSKVEKARAVNTYAPIEIKSALESGEMSLNQAYERTQEIRSSVSGEVKIKKNIKKISVDEFLSKARIALEEYPNAIDVLEKAFTEDNSPKEVEEIA